MIMRILRAAHLGMCFGVRDAIALALEHADAGPLTILGDLVHNPTVLSALDEKGIAVARDIAAVKTSTLMVTAHGTSERTLARTRALGLTVIEATCPLVRVAHRAVAALARDGYHIVIVGQRDHVEVRGLTGDLDRFDVVLEDADVLGLEEHPRIGVAAQTTQAVEKVRHLVALIRRRFPQSDVRFFDTVCKPTKERQSAAVDMARQADVVIVVGGRSSNNTRELVKTCARYCARVHHVETDADVRPEWLDAAAVVGLTAGTSTPDEVIDRVEARVRLCAGASTLPLRNAADNSAAQVGQIEARMDRQIEAVPRSIAVVAEEPAMTGPALSPSKGHLSKRTRWAIVVAFAIAMAWVEAASVFYIRAIVNRIEPYQADP